MLTGGGSQFGGAVRAGGGFEAFVELYALAAAAGIGFLVAAKSVLRFEAAREAVKAEYVIIGTLASFGWAIAITIGVMALRDALPAL